MSQCGGAFAAGEVHQNCGVKQRLNSNTVTLTLRQLFCLVVAGLTTGCRNSTEAAVERQDVRREKADVWTS